MTEDGVGPVRRLQPRNLVVAQPHVERSDRVLEMLALVDLAEMIPRRRIGLVWHRDRYHSPAATAFVELAGETAARLAGQIDSVTSARD